MMDTKPSRAMKLYKIKGGMSLETTRDWALVDCTTGGAEIGRPCPRVRPRGVEPGYQIENMAGQFAGDVRGRQVYIAGRTTGFRWGYVGRTPIYINLRADPSRDDSPRTQTWEYFLARYKPWPANIPDGWDASTTGHPSDSGAPIVDKETNGLVSMVWRRAPGALGSVSICIHLIDLLDDITDHPYTRGAPSAFPASDNIELDNSAHAAATSMYGQAPAHQDSGGLDGFGG